MSEPNMAAKLSAMSACFMRGRLPFASRRPARWATPIRVPALSNTSMIRKLKITMRKVSSKVREKSSWKSVGDSEGGIDTNAGIGREPKWDADNGDCQHADENTAHDAASGQRHDQHEAN